MDWVEIKEPDSHKVVYVNPKTGEMRYSPPLSEEYKPMSNNQWWELLDSSSSSHYYHNPHTGETVWEKPEDADIISLTLMQKNANHHEETVDSNGTSDEVHPQETITNHQSIDEPNVHDSNEKESPANGTPIQKTSDAFKSPLETLSPFCVEYEGRRFSSLTDDVAEQNGLRKKVNILDPPPVPPVPLEPETKNEEITKPILEPIPSEVNDSGSSSEMKRKFSRPTSDTSNMMSEDERKRFESFLILSMKDVEPTTGPINPRRAKSEKIKETVATDIPDGFATEKRQSSKYGGRRSHGVIPIAPVPPTMLNSGMSRSISLQVQPGKSLEQFNDLATHKIGFFRKKVTIANMLVFTKDPIKRPMILQRDKELKKESIGLFKLILEYMGDRKSKARGTDALALQIVGKCWEKKGLRDELYIQLCRQTTANPKKESLKRGWQLLTICLSVFPPSIKFQSYLEGYLWRNTEPSELNRGIPVEVYAKFCHKRVEKITRSGAKKGLVKSTLEEIQQAKNAPFHPSPFGSLLEDVMELQKEKHPDLTLPWVMIELCDVILRLRGPYTQGIFRIPGDIDAVNALKLLIDKGKPVPNSCDDPHTPASLLKLWFRELEDPLIPENYYQSCIDNCNNTGNALSLIDSLPKLNKKVLLHIVEFLQKFTTAESTQHTKMGLDNIAMVWAPNFLRCPSVDHVLIFENTRREMAFVRILLSHLGIPDE